MRNQTVPLFGKKYLRTTFIIGFTQFWLFVIANGLYMWFPGIINAMVEFMRDHPNENQYVCQIVYDTQSKSTPSDGNTVSIIDGKNRFSL